MRIQGWWGPLVLSWCVSVTAGTLPAFGQAGLPAGCIPDKSMFIHWRETFLLLDDPAAAGWKTYGEDSWGVTREALDGGNGDLFSGTTFLELPEEATGGRGDYLVTSSVWNTQRDGALIVAVRFQDPQNYYAVEYSSINSRLTVSLVKVLGGVRTVLETVDSFGSSVRIPDLTYGAGKESGSDISIAVMGNGLCLSIGGQVFLQAADSDLAAGSVALGQRNYHPYFDDLTVYLPIGPDSPVETDEGKTYRVAVPNRDEGNAVIMDLMEMNLGPAELVDANGSLFVDVGPLTSRQDVFDLRDYLDLGGYDFEEVKDSDSGGPGGPERHPRPSPDGAVTPENSPDTPSGP